MNGERRILEIISPSSYHEYDRPQHIITVSVIGLSGPDNVKGSTGVGKSVLCNRLVRPEYENFYINHITHLSQADFSGSPVINNDQWLYWGEAELDPEYGGKTTHIRFIEQTEFIDDETFEPLRSSRQTSDYIKRALKINLESHDKLMYICRDQLGAESAFESRTLPDGKTNIDAFLLVFDVSRLIPGQSEFITNILQALNKTKRPVFIAATKCDSIKYYLDGLQELQKLLRKKDFKNVNQTIIETSAIQNVNISELLKFIATSMDKNKGKQKILQYEDAVEARTIKLKELREDFINLIAQLLPREEWPRRQNQKQLNWKMLVKDFGVAAQPAYKYFTAAYGPKEAERIYDEHLNRSKEWWTAKEQREKLPALRNVLLEFFDSNTLIEAKWEDTVYKTKLHPMFDRYFKPVGQSLSRFTQHSQDARIPAELLQTYEAQHMFHELQKEISNKAILDAQIERFISFLAHKEVIIPGRKYSDAKMLVNEIETYEQFLPNGRAEQAYAEFQTYLINEAERNFVELLQERLPIFAAFALLKQKSSNPNLTIDNEFETYFSHALHDDKRFRQMSGLNERRRKLMQRFCNFIIHPLDDYCFAGSFCSNKQLSKIIETSYPNFHKYFPVDIVIYGEDYLVDEFITAVNMSLSMDHLFDYDSGLAKISCYKHADPLSSSRIRSLICVVNSLDTVENFMGVKWKAAPGLPPLFVNASTSSDEGILQQHVSQIADKIGGVYISEDNLSCVETSSIQSLTAHFHFDQIQRVLREVCHAQLCGIYADLRVQISFMCGDVFKPDVVLSMLLDQANHTSSSGNVFAFDQHLPQENLNVRIRVDATAYHSWLLSPVGWPLNSINGHILIYSPLRIASWHHAEMAARMLVAAAGPNIEEQQIVGKSILILAVDDPGNYFSNKNSRLLLTLGNKLAEEIGASFATLSPNSSGVSQMELFVNFFELIFTNDALPDAYYFPTMLAANLLTPQQNTASSSTSPSESRNREYTTLKSTGSSVSQESHDSGASVNGAFIGAFRTSTGRSITDTDSKPPPSPSSHGSGGQGRSRGKKIASGSGHMSRLSMRSNHSTASDMSSAPLAKPEFVEINNEFYYETPSTDSQGFGPGVAAIDATTKTTEKSTPTNSKQKRIEKLLPKFGRLILEGTSSSSAGPSTVIFSAPDSSQTDTPTTGVVEMFVNGTRYVQSHPPSNVTTINIPTLERSTRLSDNMPQIRFRVNGADRNVDDHGNVTIDSEGTIQIPSSSPFSSQQAAAAARLTYQIRCHSSESIFLEVDSPTEQLPPEEESPPPSTKGFLRNRRVIRRQGSLREGGNNRRSRSRGTRSFLSANLAHKFVASFRQKTSRPIQTSTDDSGVEIVSVSRLDSFGNPTKRTGPSSISMPQSPNMPKKSSLSKTSSAVSNAFSWLPNRSQKRSQRAKSEGLDQISSSPSPVDTLQSLCDAENTVDGVPLFASKCILFIEQNGGLELEGIYRVPGNQSQVAELEKQFKLNSNIDLKSINMPLHVIATAIKKFFDTLPEPIIPFILHFPIIQCIETFPTDDRSPSSMTKSSPGSVNSFSTAVESFAADDQQRQQYIDKLAKLLKHELPTVNYHVLGFLAAHLKRVAQNSHKTSMDVRNLSKVFGPTLFRPEFNSFEMMASQMSKFELAMFLILQNSDQIFGEN